MTAFVELALLTIALFTGIYVSALAFVVAGAVWFPDRPISTPLPHEREGESNPYAELRRDLDAGGAEQREGRIVTDGGRHTIWVATGQNGSPTTVYHTDPDCRYLTNAPNPRPKDETAEWYREHYRECRGCANGGRTPTGSAGRDHYEALVDAATSGDHGILDEDDDVPIRGGGSA